MSRQPTQPQRPLSLTEELEKLEQSITLTLQGMSNRVSMVNRLPDMILTSVCLQRSTTILAKPIEL